jgi:tRNA 2-thiocytidine biosynthesis protein TtcA
MVRDGDRVLLGLSGGKDSLSLLHILLHLGRHAPVRFEIGAATVVPGSDDFDPSALRRYVPALGVPYFYLEEPIAERARVHLDKPSYCAFCARMKRGTLYSACRRRGYNVLALAQHLDDLAESFLMSAFHEGKLNTMKAHYVNDAGDVRIIRPLVYARERQLAEFARTAGLPVIAENCPACFAKPTKRAHMKALLAREEREHRQLFPTLLAAIRPLMARGHPDHAAGEGKAPHPRTPL